MRFRLPRRDFLKVIVVTAAASPLPACSGDDESSGGSVKYSTDPADVARVFPQGLASGDPKPDSIILWTRVEPEDQTGAIDVIYELATDEEFTAIVAQGTVKVDEGSDHTVRIKVQGLDAYTQYYYRFKGRRVQSDVGRTKTAPTADQDVAVRFAFASCQDFIGRYYHAWQALADEDPVDFVVFLGDYIYETNGDPLFQLSSEERKIEIAEGLVIEQGDPPVKAAKTLGDYRGLYRQYRSDEHLKKIHQLYPFICIWDDHEFANDSWQDHATDFDDKKGDEKSTERREAANQAWFEFQPADVEYDAEASYPNDIKIYRTLRYGKHVDLVMTDQRSYRDDHTVPEGAATTDKPAGAPADVPTYAEAGKLGKNSALGSRNFVKKDGFDKIEAYVKPTMLGSEQKQWLIDAIKNSDATWKVWCNETQLLQMAVYIDIPLLGGVWYLTADQWDGYRTERAEVLAAISGVENFVAITGDIHAFYAGELHVDFDNPTTPMGVEYVTAGITSSPFQEIVSNAVLGLDPDGSLGLKALAEDPVAFDAALATQNPHYKYLKSFSHGVAIVNVDKDQEFKVTFLNIDNVRDKTFSGQVERIELGTKAGTNLVELKS